MNNKNINKNTILLVIILLLGLIIAGGTFAWLTATLNVTRGTYNVASTCFMVDYTDNTQTLSGTLFPSVGPNKGLSGSVSMKINSSCLVLGKGTLYLHVNDGTSTKFGAVVDAHCENPSTYITIPDYATSSTCTTNGGVWVTNGTALKYAIYDNNTFTGSPLAKGYFSNSWINNDGTLYSNFDVLHTAKTYYIYVWLDGYVSDNTYTELPFNGYIKAVVEQSISDVPSGYQQVEYIRSNGTQYIDTQVTPNQNTSVELVFNALVSGNQDYFGTSNSSNGYVYGFYDGGSKVYDNYNDDPSPYNSHISGKMTLTKKKNVTTVTGAHNFTYTHSTSTFTAAHSMYLFARWKSSGAYRPATMECYSFKVWNNDTLIRNFIPCYRISDGVRGLYDNVNDVFYTNGNTSGAAFTIPT